MGVTRVFHLSTVKTWSAGEALSCQYCEIDFLTSRPFRSIYEHISRNRFIELLINFPQLPTLILDKISNSNRLLPIYSSFYKPFFCKVEKSISHCRALKPRIEETYLP